jgi:TRAP transporter 4TM/12TM fusion protein
MDMSVKSDARSIQPEDRFLKYLLTFVALGTVTYQMVSTQILFQSAMEHQIIHLGLVLLLITLSATIGAKSQFNKYFWICIAIFSIISISYIKVFYQHLEENIGFPEAVDAVIGFLLIVVVVTVTFKSWGLVFPLIVTACIAYFFLGHLLPNPLFHPRISLSSGISFLSIGFGSGIFGRFLAIMADYGFLLIFFGALLETMGANKFFLEMGKLGGRISYGGTAQSAVVGSSLVGMASGSAIANVMITGSFTIPTMKKFGYKPHVAGAIEAVASAGSQLMPPIMGATAFLMASFLGIPYSRIIIAAIIPALLYYFAVGLNVELYARRHKIKPPKEEIDFKLLLERSVVFLVPLGFLTILLFMHKSAGFTSFYAILLIILIGFLRKGTRPSFRLLIQGIERGAVTAAKITIVIATVAMVAQTMISTGLGNKLAYIVGVISAGNLAVTLILTMVLSIFMGCGIPGSAAYALVAILIVPSVINMGIPILQIHFFVLYFAIISAITPPVALASLGAAAIAKSNYTKTGYEGVKLGFSGYVIPFFIVFNPVLLMNLDSSMNTIYTLIAAVLSIFFMSVSLYGHLFYNISAIMRIIMGLCAVIFGAYVITMKLPLFYVGIIAGIGFVSWQGLQTERRQEWLKEALFFSKKPKTI